MDGITALIKNEIRKQYGTLKDFAKMSGIPYSTLTNTLTKGVEGTAYGTVVRICKLLDIKQSYDLGLVMFNADFFDLYQKLSALDDQGLHTVSTILNMEYERCKNVNSTPSVKAFNAIGLAVKQEDNADKTVL